MTEDETLTLTRNMRLRIVDTIAPIDEALPTDKDSLELLYKALDGLDRQALTIKRIGSDDANADADREANAAALTVMRSLGTQNPFLNVTSLTPNIDANTDSALLPEIVLIPGELDVTPEVLNLEEFSNLMQLEEANR